MAECWETYGNLLIFVSKTPKRCSDFFWRSASEEVAFTLADKVVVVTNAEEGWVNLSCRVRKPNSWGGLRPPEITKKTRRKTDANN